MMYLGQDAVGIATAKYVDFNPYKYCSSIYRHFYQAELPATVIIDFENKCPKTSDAFWESFRESTGIETIIIKNLIMPDSGFQMPATFRGSSVKTIYFDNCTIKPTRSDRCFSCDNIAHIYGPIDMSLIYGNSASAVSDAFYFARKLEDVEFVPNSLHKHISFSGLGSGTYLNDTSFISIGNAMNANYPDTQSLDSNIYLNRVKAIMGKNENGLFVADENGTLSLYDFMTTIKGWTITN